MEIKTAAYPGLMSLLDTALYHSNEGELTSTTSSAQSLLCTFLELKSCSQELLLKVQLLEGSEEEGWLTYNWLDLAESFARLCIECSTGAIERLTTDKLAVSANGSSSEVSSEASATIAAISDASEGVVESSRSMDFYTGAQIRQRGDVWESPRLFCPDYMWADDVFTYCQRLLRMLTKHRFLSSGGGISTMPLLQILSERIVDLLTDALPSRLHQFRIAVESDSALTKRLYLLKVEYRAPFRSFLEAHATIQKTPSKSLLEKYYANREDKEVMEIMRKEAEQRLSDVFSHAHFLSALRYERQCEILEIGMARMLLPFAELARFLDGKRARLLPVPSSNGYLLHSDDVPKYRELLRRLKLILTRKPGQETSAGIRPILLDLQGIQRRHIPPQISPFDIHSSTPQRLSTFLHQLTTLTKISQKKGTFLLPNTLEGTTPAPPPTTTLTELEIPSPLLKNCTRSLDTDMFSAQFQDWQTCLLNQRKKLPPKSLAELSQKLRKCEMEVQIAKMSPQVHPVMKQRIENLERDRERRFEVLQKDLEEMCAREINLQLNLVEPDRDMPLELPEFTGCLGVFGDTLVRYKEVLPLG